MKYGAKGAKWAPMTADTDANAMPTYGTVLDYGGINESNDTLNFAEASAYADNMEKIRIREFSDGSVSTKALFQEIACKSAILGTDTDGETSLSYGGEDNPPFGAYGFYCNKMDANKTKYYEVVFYPKVQGYVEGENYKTKESSISLEYDSLSFYIFQAACGKYKIEKRFTDEDEAVAYLAALYAGTATVSGVNDTASTDSETTDESTETT